MCNNNSNRPEVQAYFRKIGQGERRGGRVIYTTFNDSLKRLGTFERTTLSAHTRHTSANSTVIPGLRVQGPTYFVCLRCKTESDEPEHGDQWECVACGQGYETYGNYLGIALTSLSEEAKKRGNT